MFLRDAPQQSLKRLKSNKSLLGVHIEGPFFNVKYRGVHQKQYINTINSDYLNLFEKLTRLSSHAHFSTGMHFY